MCDAEYVNTCVYLTVLHMTMIKFRLADDTFASSMKLENETICRFFFSFSRLYLFALKQKNALLFCKINNNIDFN